MPVITSIQEGNLLFVYTISDHSDADVFTLHCHNGFEIYFFVSGEGYYLIEGSRYELKPYSLGVIRPGEVHCFRSSGQSPYERYVLNFMPDSVNAEPEEKRLLLSPFFERAPGKNNFYRTVNDRSIIQIYNEFTYAADLPEVEKRLLMNSLFSLLLSKILVMFRHGVNSKTETCSSDLVTEVLRFINENLAEHLTLDEISARFYISKYHLSRVFKSLTGVSVIEYLIRKRVFLSQQLLRSGATATEACSKSGFGDYTSFYRAFRRIVGCSPLEIKENSVHGGRIAL